MTEAQRQIRVEGMSCQGCERAVEAAVKQVAGVVAAAADHGSGTVTLTVAGELDEAELAERITSAGYGIK